MGRTRHRTIGKRRRSRKASAFARLARIRAANYLPGTDAAGIVVAVGEKVDRFRPGDRVACAGWHGAFAERMTAKASGTALLPDSVDFIAGSTLLHMYLTAYYALISRAQVRPGETVLITGAAGGVGLACVELARLLDTRLRRAPS